jgi:hypothetical protein
MSPSIKENVKLRDLTHGWILGSQGGDYEE